MTGVGDEDTTAKVIGTVTLVGGLVAMWYLFFRDEKPKVSGLSGSKLRIGVQKAPLDDGWIVRGGGVLPSVVLYSKKQADQIARAYRRVLRSKKNKTIKRNSQQ